MKQEKKKYKHAIEVKKNQSEKVKIKKSDLLKRIEDLESNMKNLMTATHVSETP